MASAATLYNPEMLTLATGLAAWPLRDGLPLRGEARSPTCGSAIAIGLKLDPGGTIADLGLRAHACAIGQAAAAIFAQSALGRDRSQLARTENDLSEWLTGSGPQPDWPGIAVIAPALAYPARHGAILLAWRAALAALPTD
jgi:NifU-like protein involved in Fe-S cluster formation